MKINWFELTKGIIKENPTFVIVLGLCPTLAVTNLTINGLGMGLAVIFVLSLSNLLISLLRNFIPNEVRIPCYIIVIAAFVTIIQFVMEAFTPELNKALGIFIPLIVVNCIILGRAEAFAGKNKPLDSFLDGIGMGIGFTLALTLIGLIREILGNGTITLKLAGVGTVIDVGAFLRNIFGEFNKQSLIPKSAIVMMLPPGGFIVMGTLLAFFQYLKNKKAEKEQKMKAQKKQQVQASTGVPAGAPASTGAKPA